MSAGQGSRKKDLESRFLRHLTGKADESERQELERAVLEDDELFDQLSDLESELIDAYVDGELDEETTHSLASLVGSSSRLQAKAETTLALSQRPSRNPGLSPASESGATEAKNRSPRQFALYGGVVVLALIAWLLFQATRLRTEVRNLRVDNVELQERAEALESTVSELEMSNRKLTRRLARLEAERQR